ncbi:hypothetical protein TNCV_4707291 [Trichonephila clavipes]|nr:hypothetical protein TNCV_4707291 [Trichonephila clavipes]
MPAVKTLSNVDRSTAIKMFESTDLRVGYVQWTTSPPVLRVEQSTLTSHPVRNARLKRDTGKYADRR